MRFKLIYLLLLMVVATTFGSSSLQFSTGSSSGGGSGVSTMSAIGSSANANGATITGTALNLEPASASFGGVVTTGAQTLAGAKTLSSAPILSSLSAQAMPYLNASKTFANGGWTQADTSFATTFTPGGTTANPLILNFSSDFDEALSLNGGFSSTGNDRMIYMAPSTTGGTDRFLYALQSAPSASSMTTSTLVGVYGTSSGDNSGGQIGALTAAVKGTFGLYGRSTNTSTTGHAFGVAGLGYGAKTNVGGWFHALTPLNVASNKAIGVQAIATKENSAQATAVYGKIYSATDANVENSLPAFNAAGIFDNGDTGNDSIIALNNGASTFHVRGGVNNAVVLGQAGTTTAVHEVNGAVSAGGSDAMTLLNGPAGTANNPDTFIRIKINGVLHVIPAWTPTN